MASLFNTSSMLFLSLVFFISFVPSSMANDFRHVICSRTTNPNECLSLNHVKTAPNTQGLAKASVDLALAAATNIHAQLNDLYRSEKDQNMKDIYMICSKNYNDAIRDFTVAKRSFEGSKNYKIIPYEANDAEEEVKDCITVFNGATSDPKNIRKANEDFYLLAQIARTSSQLFVKN